MNPEEYEKMYELEGRYWWFQGRKAIVLSMLDAALGEGHGGLRLLDLGCGTGLILKLLQEKHEVFGLDFSALSMEYSRRRGATGLLRGDAQRLPFAEGSFDLITTLDLTEHVARDDLMLAECRRVLRPGGLLLLTVPAHPYLWSEHDEALHHQRRYTRRMLEKRLCGAGLEIERLTFCITFTFPIILGYRLLRGLTRPSRAPQTHLVMPPGWANGLLTRSVELEAWLLRRMNLPFGVSLLALGRRGG